VVSWSPASSWDSFARAVATGEEAKLNTQLVALVPTTPRRFFDLQKFLGVRGSGDRMMESEASGSLHDFFHAIGGRRFQADRSYAPSWACREDAKTWSRSS
jgi:hypothetical protein